MQTDSNFGMTLNAYFKPMKFRYVSSVANENAGLVVRHKFCQFE